MKNEKKEFRPENYLIDLPKSQKDKETGQWKTVHQKYLPVAARVLWFRIEHPDWKIRTFPIKFKDGEAIFRASILNDKDEILSTAIKRETAESFGDYLEKAETGAIGRALALVGYGTLFAPELEEGERIVDTPKEVKPKVENRQSENPISEAQKKALLMIDKDWEGKHTKNLDQLTFQEAAEEIKEHGKKAVSATEPEEKIDIDEIPF